MLTIKTTPTNLPEAKATNYAKYLNADECDGGWEYKAVLNGSFSHINVYDEDNNFLGAL